MSTVEARLHPRERAVLKFIKDYWDKHGYAPSHREVQAGLGMLSSSTVTRWIEKLELKGLLERGYHGQHRAMRPTR